MLQAAVPRRRRTPRLPFPVLPEELVVWDILVRLPAKALPRCRAVCRSWRRLTSTADFLLAHHRHQPSLPLVFFHGQIRDSSCNVWSDSDLDGFDLRGATAERRPILHFNDFSHPREYKVYASCDGLLLYSLHDSIFYICNPATRQRKVLPSLSSTNVVGMYRHSSSGEYRILYLRKEYRDSGYHMLTVGSYANPRCIGLPAAAVSGPIRQYIAAGPLFVCEHPPVLLHSCLHWIIYRSRENALVVFDTVSESFRRMSRPVAVNGRWRHLLDIDGALGISHMDESKTMVKLCVLQDYDTEVWSLKYQIELPMVELRGAGMNCRFEVFVASEEGDLLVFCSSLCHIFHCDSKGKLLQKFQWRHVCSKPIGHWFKESLVRHAFFQGQESDHAVHFF
ncbi:unnamed protein product [Urochloa decumbens]|uniref:F-box domain-containing protein n=1 Tax=Urochloa decumbens TaxID=240449 RepID=A0ABC9A0C4_9POAL